MRIDVTAEDIAHGIPLTTDRCPLALAIKRATPCRYVWLSAYEGAAHLDLGLRRIKRAILPPRTLAFAKNFDRQRHVKPFSFDLDV